MSYSRGLGAVCPPGWSDVAGVCHSDTAESCPAGFEQHGQDCWPVTLTACRDILGTYFNPAQPDRCVKTCPEGTEPDVDNVCRQAFPTVITGDPPVERSFYERYKTEILVGVVLSAIGVVYVRGR